MGSEIDAIVRHITSASNDSPFVSITKSFAIARSYAQPIASTEPGKVWEIHIPDGTLDELLVNPIQVILKHSPRAQKRASGVVPKHVGAAAEDVGEAVTGERPSLSAPTSGSKQKKASRLSTS